MNLDSSPMVIVAERLIRNKSSSNMIRKSLQVKVIDESAKRLT
jgi:hypothetical protein